LGCESPVVATTSETQRGPSRRGEARGVAESPEQLRLKPAASINRLGHWALSRQTCLLSTFAQEGDGRAGPATHSVARPGGRCLMVRVSFAILALVILVMPVLDLGWNEPKVAGHPGMPCPLHTTPIVDICPATIDMALTSEPGEVVPSAPAGPRGARGSRIRTRGACA
jgi:hypothetical protein